LALSGVILYRERTTEDEMNTEDRRAPGATRMPFEGLVEVGGALGPSFEAQAVNVSEDGIHLRTAYLPEQGQPLTCRFDAGSGQSVLASGEVVWAAGADKGGEFGVRFTDMDAESVDSLKRIIGVASRSAEVQSGSKVRLHIDGLASPMRAKIKDARSTAVTVGSDLGFLQVGRQLELEDAQSGRKRPACIDRVEVAVDPASHVPQLVVTLRSADMDASAGSESPVAVAPTVAAAADDLASAEEASLKMKGVVAHKISRIGPALGRFADRAKTMVALLAKRASDAREDGAMSRRTTGLPVGGGLHASGRRVVRGEPATPAPEPASMASRFGSTQRKVIVGGAVMAVAIAGALVLKKSHGDAAPQVATAAPGAGSAVSASETPPAASTAVAAAVLPPGSDSAGALTAPVPQSVAPVAVATADDTSDSSKTAHKKHARVAPFGNGPVHHGNVLRLKMDGPIDSLEGAQQPTGFVVKLPGRRSLEAAGPLAARDGRIAAIKVANETAGAELTIAFKDGVPNYQVSARGDTLVISLAPAGDLASSKDEKVAKSSKHKHAR
jgi:hypothetical protein